MSDDDEIVVDSRGDLARMLRRFRRQSTERRYYVRFGRWSGRSRRWLDSEFLATAEGGLWDPHRTEAGGGLVRYERGVSAYFALEAPDGTGWHMLDPSRRRASYNVTGSYWAHMGQHVFLESMCAGEVYLVKADPVHISHRVSAYVEDERKYYDITIMDHDVGADGEPVVQNVEVVSQFDVWGDRPDLPKLYLGYPGERKTEFIDYLVRHQSAFAPRVSRDRDETCSVLEESEETYENPRRRNSDERLRRLERLAPHDPLAMRALQAERLRHGDRRLGALLSAVRVLWIRPWSGSMYGILYSMRPGQSPTDIWRAEWPAWGDRAGKPAEQVPGDWVYLPTVENIQRDLTPEDRRDLLEFLERHRAALPRQVYEWVDLEQFYRPESDHGAEATRNAGRKWRSLAEEFPELIAEWSDKNLPLTPADVTPGVRNKMWWRCMAGHPDYPARPATRVIGSGCPTCAGMYSDNLAVAFPELVVEWSDKNLPLRPEDVTPGSEEEVWWRCLSGDGHDDYDLRVSHRVDGIGCPTCAGMWDTSLAKAFPELVAKWSDKNLPLRPEDVTPGSEKEAWWRCLSGKGHEDYRRPIDDEIRRKKSCPKCAGRWKESFAVAFPALAAEWSDKNMPLRPEDVTPGVATRVLWICKNCKHEWTAAVQSRAMRGTGCPRCWRLFRQRRVLPKPVITGRKGAGSKSPRRSTRGGSSFDIGPRLGPFA